VQLAHVIFAHCFATRFVPVKVETGWHLAFPHAMPAGQHLVFVPLPHEV
jgi:hypothetical protein